MFRGAEIPRTNVSTSMTILQCHVSGLRCGEDSQDREEVNEGLDHLDRLGLSENLTNEGQKKK